MGGVRCLGQSPKKNRFFFLTPSLIKITTYSTWNGICLSWHLVNGTSLLGSTSWCGQRYGYTVVVDIYIYASKAKDTSYILKETQSSVEPEFNSDGLHYNVFSQSPGLAQVSKMSYPSNLKNPKSFPLN